MGRIVTAALIALALASDPAFAAPGDEGFAKAKEAATALQRGNADQAVLLYSTALADQGLSNDRRAAFLNDRGVALARLNKLRAAIDDFNMSVQLAPEGASAYNNRGNVLLALGLAAEAEKDFNRALVLAPGYAAAYINRASARSLAGDTDSAIRDFGHAAHLTPKSPAAFGGLGRLHLTQNRPHAALRDLSRAVANDSRYGPGYRLKAEALVLLGRFDEAIEDLSRAITFDATNSELHLARGYAYLAARNAAMAVKDFQRSFELAPKFSGGPEGLALAQARLGAHDDALDSLSKALEIEPRSAQAYAYRSLVYKMMGQVDLGQKDLDRALRLEAERPEVLWARAELLEVAGQREEAIADLRKAQAGRPHLRDVSLALERLGAQDARDAEVAELGMERWRVFVRQGRHYTSNADYPRLNVPLEMMSEGTPRLVGFEVKGGPQAGIGILRFLAGAAEGAAAAGSEEIDHGAVLDLQQRQVLAVETMRQGTKRASWTWGEDKLVVTGLDGFKQEYAFKGPKARDVLAQKQDPAAEPAPKPRPRPSSQGSGQGWNPFGDNSSSGGGQRAQQQPQRRQPKTLFELLFN